MSNIITLVGSVNTNKYGIQKVTVNGGIEIVQNVQIWKRDDNQRVVYTMPVKTYNREVAEQLTQFVGNGNVELHMTGELRTEYWTNKTTGKLENKTCLVVQSVDAVTDSEVNNFEKREYTPSN